MTVGRGETTIVFWIEFVVSAGVLLSVMITLYVNEPTAPAMKEFVAGDDEVINTF